MRESYYNLKDFPSRVKKLTTKIYLQEKVEDLAELIKKIMFDGIQTFSHPTYHKLQCDSGRARSIEDIYLAAKLINPKVSPTRVFKAIKSLYGERSGGVITKKGLLRWWQCSTVHRRVHRQNNVYSPSLKTIREEIGDLNIKF